MSGNIGERVVLGEGIAPELPEGLRKELVDHHKWIFGIGSLLLTLSIGLVGLRPGGVVWKPVLLAGWLSLAASMFHSWLAVKRHVTLAVFREKTQEELGRRDQLYLSTLDLLAGYGTLSNVALVVGGTLLLVGLLAQVSVAGAWVALVGSVLYVLAMGVLIKRLMQGLGSHDNRS